jgi:hypothetical protein
VFHSPQEGHFPVHLGDCAPQELQINTFLTFDNLFYLVGPRIR